MVSRLVKSVGSKESKGVRVCMIAMNVSIILTLVTMGLFHKLDKCTNGQLVLNSIGIILLSLWEC